MTFASGPIARNPFSLVPPPTGNLGDMSLLKNVPNQNFTFELVNVTNSNALTGATIVGFTSKDGGAQASTTGTFSELGNGVYNYAPTQAETNGNCVSFLITASSAVPENLMFLTGGLHKNQVATQHVTFVMMTTAGIADTGAAVSVFVSKDGGAQGAGGGTVTNLGNGQYDYVPTQAETNGTNVSFLFTATGDIPINISIFTVP